MLVILDALSGALPFVIRGLASSTSGLLPALVYSATDLHTPFSDQFPIARMAMESGVEVTE